MKLLLTILIFFYFSKITDKVSRLTEESQPPFATTYYVDFTLGLDANNGTSTATPWKTIAKVQASTFSPGDFVRFKSGEMWREQLIIPSSGTAGNLITFGAYGTGAKPIINGADITTGWTTSATNVWWTTSPNATTTRAMVIIDGVVYAEVASVALVNSANEYFIDVSASPDRLYVFSTTDPDNLVAEVSKRNYGFIARDQDDRHHCAFVGLEFRYAGTTGLQLEGEYQGPQVQGNFVVDDCFFYANRAAGCDAHDGVTDNVFKNSVATYNGNGFYAWISDNVTMQNCSTAHNINYQSISLFTDGHGFGVYAGDNFIIENCESFDDAGGAVIDAGGAANGGIIRYNYFHNSQTFHPGISTGNLTTGDTIEIYYNLLVNNGGTTGTAFEDYLINTGVTLFYNNTIYNNTLNGGNGTIFLTNGDNIVFKNNIVMSERGDFQALLFNQNPALLTSDYNQWFQLDSVNSPARFHYNGTYRNTLANWQAGVSQDLNSQSGNPLFINKASDWHLQSGSPAINKGVDVGLTRDFHGNQISGAPDMGAFEYSPTKLLTITSDRATLMEGGTRYLIRDPFRFVDGDTATQICTGGSGDDIYFPNYVRLMFDSAYSGVKLRMNTGSGSFNCKITLWDESFVNSLVVNLTGAAYQAWQWVDTATTKAWGFNVRWVDFEMLTCIGLREVEFYGNSTGAVPVQYFPNSTLVFNTKVDSSLGMNAQSNEPDSLWMCANAYRWNGNTSYNDTNVTGLTGDKHKFILTRYNNQSAILQRMKDSNLIVFIYSQGPSAAYMIPPRPYDAGVVDQYAYYNHNNTKNIPHGSDSTDGDSWRENSRWHGTLAIMYGGNASANDFGYTISQNGGSISKGSGLMLGSEDGNEVRAWWVDKNRWHSNTVVVVMNSGSYDSSKAKDPNWIHVQGAHPIMDTNDMRAQSILSYQLRGYNNYPTDWYAFNTYCTRAGGQSQDSTTEGISPEKFQLLEKLTQLVAFKNKYLGAKRLVWTELNWSASPNSIYRATAIGTKSARRVASDQTIWSYHLSRMAGIDGFYPYRLIDDNNNQLGADFSAMGAVSTYNQTNPDSSFKKWPLWYGLRTTKIWYANYAGQPQLIKHGDSTSLWVIRDNPEPGDSMTTFTFKMGTDNGSTTSIVFDPGQTCSQVSRIDLYYGPLGNDLGTGDPDGVVTSPAVASNRLITLNNIGESCVTVRMKLGPLKEKIRYGRGI